VVERAAAAGRLFLLNTVDSMIPSTDGDRNKNPLLIHAGRITVGFLTLHLVCILNVVFHKRRCLTQAMAENKVFDRYTSPLRHVPDRMFHNLLEWTHIFLGLLWSLVATGNLNQVSFYAAWAYVGVRALYIVLVLQYGVASNGMNKALWIATVPAYFCLICMFRQASYTLFLI
jgi:uncharacterized MAPEG superfamily protein